jgi:hypothetical protein
LFSRARRLTEKNRADWNLSLGRADNLLICSYLILSDYAAGLFPPAHLDQAAAYENEMQYGQALGGISPGEFQAKGSRFGMRTPRKSICTVSSESCVSSSR